MFFGVYRSVFTSCKCGVDFKRKIPRVYARGESGNAVLVGFDIICDKCKTIRNVDVV